MNGKLGHWWQVILGGVGLITLFLGILAVRDADTREMVDAINKLQQSVTTLIAQENQLQAATAIIESVRVENSVQNREIAEIKALQKVNMDRITILEQQIRELIHGSPP